MHEWKSFFLGQQLRSDYWHSYANPSDSKVCKGFLRGISVREQFIPEEASGHSSVFIQQKLGELGKDKYFRLETDEG